MLRKKLKSPEVFLENMIIQKVGAKAIKDSRGEKTIEVSIETNFGRFRGSAPAGKSTGKFEVKPYKKSLEEDIKTLQKFSDYFSSEIIETFDDLRRIEDILDRHVGGNSVLALEYASLKALAKEQQKEVWQLINAHAKKFPRLVGNCVGGGAHTKAPKKPDFQEFLIIPKTKAVKESFEQRKKIQEQVGRILSSEDETFRFKKNDENAWVTGLNEKEILEILAEHKTALGLDIAASNFYKRKKYHYDNPMLTRTPEEQLSYMENLIKNFKLAYVEDPFGEEDFESHAQLLKKTKECMIVGDDLTVTNATRLKKAIDKKAIDAIIIKPNQCGSLLEVKKVVELCKKEHVKMIFSHRSGETTEDMLADLAFGFGADFLKIGISGKERESKIKRLIEIEKKLSR